MQSDTEELVIHTDGSSLGNPGPGGWAWWCPLGWASGGAERTTNNIMELTAVLEALRACEEAGHRRVLVRTDSRYLIDALTKWVWGWRKRGWVTSSGTPVANRELIEALVAAEGCLESVRYEWVKGHNGDEGNERADDLARRQAGAWRDGRGRPAGTGFQPA